MSDNLRSNLDIY